MNILIGVNNAGSDYSQTAFRIWRQMNGYGLGLDFKTSPDDGLIDALNKLKAEKKITDYRYEPKTDNHPYYYVSFEIPIPAEDAPLAENGEFASLIEVAEIINQYF
jgi:hypothetical protein